MTVPMNPVQDWEAVRALPEGAALADAYLTLRSELNTLICYCQAVERDRGMTPKGLREHAESLIPLLNEGPSRAWTEGYFDARSVLGFVRSDLEAYVGYKTPYLPHWYVDRALRRLSGLPLPVPADEEVTLAHAQAEAALLRERFQVALETLRRLAESERPSDERKAAYQQAAVIVQREYGIALAEVTP